MVGDATAAALADIQHISSSNHFAPQDIRGGAESGTSEKLAHFILQDLGRNAGITLLYLTGDKNRDTLPSILKDGELELLNLQVYGTKGSSHFESDLVAALQTAPSRERPDVVAHTSPFLSLFRREVVDRILCAIRS